MTVDLTRKESIGPDFSTVGHDTNIFCGWAVFNRLRYYIEEDEKGDDDDAVTDKRKMLTDISAREHEILGNKEYLTKYYDTYYGILNQGGLTLISNAYIRLFHNILFEVAKNIDLKKMDERAGEAIKMARKAVVKKINIWKPTFQRLVKPLELTRSESADELLEELTMKIFNARTAFVVKRYQAIHFARGGKKEHRSTSREERKGENKKRKQN
jgi:hypothetical protein